MSLSQRQKTGLQTVIGLGLGFGLLYLAFRNLSWSAIRAALAQADYRWVAAAMGMFVAAQGSRAWRWAVLLQTAHGGRLAPIGRLWTGTNIGYLVNVGLPRVGEVVRAVSVNRTTGLPMSPVLATIVVERVLDLLCLIVILTLGLYFNAAELNALLPARPLPVIGQLDLLWLRNLVLLGTVAVLVVLAALVARPEPTLRLVGAVVRRISAHRADGVVAALRGFIGGFEALRQPRQYLALAVSSVGVWGGYLAMLYLPLHAFGIPEQSGLSFANVFALMAVTSVGSSFVPGGTGAFHYLCALTLGAFGVSAASAGAFALVSHGSTTVTVMLLGLGSLVHQALLLRRRTAAGGERAVALPGGASRAVGIQVGTAVE